VSITCAGAPFTIALVIVIVHSVPAAAFAAQPLTVAVVGDTAAKLVNVV
jgi:hypothetical protein